MQIPCRRWVGKKKSNLHVYCFWKCKVLWPEDPGTGEEGLLNIWPFKGSDEKSPLCLMQWCRVIQSNNSFGAAASVTSVHCLSGGLCRIWAGLDSLFEEWYIYMQILYSMSEGKLVSVKILIHPQVRNFISFSETSLKLQEEVQLFPTKLFGKVNCHKI